MGVREQGRIASEPLRACLSLLETWMAPSQVCSHRAECWGPVTLSLQEWQPEAAPKFTCQSQLWLTASYPGFFWLSSHSRGALSLLPSSTLNPLLSQQPCPSSLPALRSALSSIVQEAGSYGGYARFLVYTPLDHGMVELRLVKK